MKVIQAAEVQEKKYNVLLCILHINSTILCNVHGCVRKACKLNKTPYQCGRKASLTAEEIN